MAYNVRTDLAAKDCVHLHHDCGLLVTPGDTGVNGLVWADVELSCLVELGDGDAQHNGLGALGACPTEVRKYPHDNWSQYLPLKRHLSPFLR